ncbi:MAG: PLP-dependent cysteine synthase family protein [Planctomycetota bacterium]
MDLSAVSTPLLPVDLGRGVVWCKLEHLNASGSIKDRIAIHMITRALRRGELKPGGLVVEASSGSTALSLAMVCARIGVRFAAFMPEGVSRERVQIIRAYGGEVVLSDRDLGVRGSAERARAHARQHGAYEPRQFENPDNVAAHEQGTAVELLEHAPGGTVDAFVAGVGTGGTLMGVGRGLRARGCDAALFAARPIVRSHSACVAGCCFDVAEQCSFSSRIPGVLDGFSTLYRPDDIPGGIKQIEVADDLAIDTMHRLIRAGFPVGPSSGLNVAAAELLLDRLPPGAVVTTVLCDRVERYLSTPLFAGKQDTPC